MNSLGMLQEWCDTFQNTNLQYGDNLHLWLHILTQFTVCVAVRTQLRKNISFVHLDMPLYLCNKFKLVKGYVELV
jgi:hypothetical protein